MARPTSGNQGHVGPTSQLHHSARWKQNIGKIGGGTFKPAQIWLSYIRTLQCQNCCDITIVVMLGARIDNTASN